MKRIVDVIVAVLVLALLSPLLVLVSFLIWLQDRRSPFYIADRVGRNMKPFRMVKFRSMVVNADKTGVDSTGANDSRITSIGKFVRKTKLDEVPQMWNVLKGEMSLVGPRPNVAMPRNNCSTFVRASLISRRSSSPTKVRSWLTSPTLTSPTTS